MTRSAFWDVGGRRLLIHCVIKINEAIMKKEKMTFPSVQPLVIHMWRRGLFFIVDSQDARFLHYSYG